MGRAAGGGPGRGPPPPDIASLPELVRANFLLFEQDAEINEAYARVDTTVTAVPKLEQRNRAVEAEVARAYPDLNRRQCLAVTGALRLNASIRTWYLLTRELGLSAEEAADTALRRRHVPSGRVDQAGAGGGADLQPGRRP